MIEDQLQQQLITLAKAGDEAAFKALVDEHLPLIFRYSNKMLTNSSDASEISQEVFVRFWEQMNRYDPSKAKLSTWLHQIAHNLCIDHFRHQKKFEDLSQQEEHTGNSLEHDLSNRETGRLLRNKIFELPERQRNALVLCHYQGVSNKDAAHIMNISVDALESLLSRARRYLREEMHHEF